LKVGGWTDEKGDSLEIHIDLTNCRVYDSRPIQFHGKS